MKKLISILMIVLLVSSLFVGCSASKDDNGQGNGSSEEKTTEATTEKITETVAKAEEPESEPEPESITLRIAWWGSQGRHDYTLQLLEMYTALHPNVTFEPEYTGWDDYWTKLSYQAAANDLPDIMQNVVGRPEPAELVNAGMFADLNPFVGKELDLSGVAEGLVSTGEVDGELIGAALSSNALAIIYDPEILASAGVEVPKFGYTWDDFADICSKINSQLGIYGTGDIETTNILYDYYPRQFGETFFVDDEDGVGISKDTLASYFNMKLKLQKEGLMPDLAEISQEMGVEDHPLVHGNAAFAWKWAPNLSTLEDPTAKPLELLPLPGPNVKDAQFVKAGMHFSVAESSAVKEEAAKFIDWFINDIEANKVINADRGIPADADVRQAMLPTLGETQKKVFEFVDFVSENSSVKETFLPENVNDIMQLIKDLEEQVLFEKVSVDEAVDTFFNSL